MGLRSTGQVSSIKSPFKLARPDHNVRREVVLQISGGNTMSSESKSTSIFQSAAPCRRQRLRGFCGADLLSPFFDKTQPERLGKHLLRRQRIHLLDAIFQHGFQKQEHGVMPPSVTTALQGEAAVHEDVMDRALVEATQRTRRGPCNQPS